MSIVDGRCERGIGFRVLDGALSSVDTRSADRRLFFQLTAAMAEFVRSLINDRTQACSEAAKAQSLTDGRRPVVNEDLPP
ncbi:recombinase family protein [Streptomyces griseorubiginosus]|uniref:recombinase family protein n=1 Tax=Streptomyces griseorubiginosus TaxID=67304 RepID=UPI00368FF569